MMEDEDEMGRYENVLHMPSDGLVSSSKGIKDSPSNSPTGKTNSSYM
jgi:hypothetical protein